MVDAFAKMLDGLMGPDRNAIPKPKSKAAKDFTDPEICKFFLCGACPYELFNSTVCSLCLLLSSPSSSPSSHSASSFSPPLSISHRDQSPPPFLTSFLHFSWQFF